MLNQYNNARQTKLPQINDETLFMFQFPKIYLFSFHQNSIITMEKQ